MRSRLLGFDRELNSISLWHVTDLYRFEVGFCGLDWVPNFEKTRWFVVLRLNVPNGNGLNKLLHVCNSTVQQHGQPPLYAKLSEEPAKKKESVSNARTKGRRGSELKTDWSSMQEMSAAFHISIAWSLEPPSQDLLDITNMTTTDQLGLLQKIEVKVEDVKAKLGNVVTGIQLRKNVVEAKGLFGF